MVQGVHVIESCPHFGNNIASEFPKGKQRQGATKSTRWKYRLLTLGQESLESSGPTPLDENEQGRTQMG